MKLKDKLKQVGAKLLSAAGWLLSRIRDIGLAVARVAVKNLLITLGLIGGLSGLVYLLDWLRAGEPDIFPYALAFVITCLWVYVGGLIVARAGEGWLRDATVGLYVLGILATLYFYVHPYRLSTDQHANGSTTTMACDEGRYDMTRIVVANVENDSQGATTELFARLHDWSDADGVDVLSLGKVITSREGVTTASKYANTCHANIIIWAYQSGQKLEVHLLFSPSTGFDDNLASESVPIPYASVAQSLRAKGSREIVFQGIALSERTVDNDVEGQVSDVIDYCASLARGIALYHLGNYISAVKTFKRTIQVAQRKQGLTPSRAWYFLGAAYFRLGNLTQARIAYATALTLEPKFSDAYSGLGNVSFAEHDFSKAFGEYSTALSLNPSDTLASANRCQLDLLRNGAKAALSECRHVATQHRDCEACQLTLGEIYAELGDIGAATATFLGVQFAGSSYRPNSAAVVTVIFGSHPVVIAVTAPNGADPVKLAAANDVANLAILTGDFKAAAAEYTAVMLGSQGCENCYELRASAEDAGGDTASAFADFVQALVYNSSSPSLGTNLGILEAEVGHPDLALRNFLLAADARTSAWHYVNLASAYISEGDLMLAAGELSAATKLDPAFGQARYMTGLVYMNLGNSRRAIRAFNESVALGYYPAMLFFNRAIAETVIDDYTASISDFQNAIRLGYASTDSSVYSNLGVAFVASGQPQQAKVAFSELLLRDPTSVAGFEGRALAELDAGELQAARLDVEKALVKGFDEGKVWWVLGDIDYLDGNPPVALQDYDKASSLWAERWRADMLAGYHNAINGNPFDAEISLTTALASRNLAQTPDWAIAHVFRAEARIRTLRIAAAISDLGNANDWFRAHNLMAAYKRTEYVRTFLKAAPRGTPSAPPRQ